MAPPSDQSEEQMLNDTINHFKTTQPWTMSLLTAPSHRLSTPTSRHPKSSTEDSLFALTLRSPSTISHALTLYPFPSPSVSVIPSLTTLFTLGDDMNGFPSVLHGGIVASLLDEGMGILLTHNADLEHIRAVGRGERDGEWAEEGLGLVTKRLEVGYRRPVRTPGCVVVRAAFVEGKDGAGREKKGRRAREIEATVEQWDEKKGELVVCARGLGEFIEPRSGKL